MSDNTPQDQNTQVQPPSVPASESTLKSLASLLGADMALDIDRIKSRLEFIKGWTGQEQAIIAEWLGPQVLNAAKESLHRDPNDDRIFSWLPDSPKRHDLLVAALPLITWMKANLHPHFRAIVDGQSIELVEGVVREIVHERPQTPDKEAVKAS